MMDLLRIFLILALAIPPVMPAYATEGVGPAVDTVTGTGQCDWSGLKESLGYTESGGRYGITNPWNYLGKYQFGEARLNAIGWWDDPQIVDPGQCMSNGRRNSARCETQCGPVQKGYAACYNEFSGHWTGEAYTAFGITSYRDFLANGPAQERAFDVHASLLYRETKGCHNAIGRTITDRKGRTCVVTMSGIIAGGHLAGASGVCNYLNKGGGAADNATHVSDYICTHRDIPVPIDGGQCTSEIAGGRGPLDPGSQPPTDPEFRGIGSGGVTVEHYELVGDLILRVWVAGLAVMANQMVATMMAQAEIIGSFFDAKHQLETQRLLQQKAARAHKDYHPSEQMCTIGTFSRNLLDTERRANFTQATLAQRGIQRELMSGENLTVQANVSDRQSRFETFRTKFCNSKDNAGTLGAVCADDIKPEMINRDIDYTRTIDLPLTIAIDPLDDANAGDDGLAAHMLMDNLFQPHPAASIRQDITTLENFQDVYQDLRAIVAMRTVARNSLNNIIAQKSSGAETSGESTNTAFLRALIKDMGITDEDEITAILGERPSYYAQMEILTKKLYQHPGFVVNLYDKPANVARMRAAMRAIKVMQDRDIYDALARREMLLSMLAELSLRKEQGRVDTLVNSLRASAR